jgi:penicillin amidase
MLKRLFTAMAIFVVAAACAGVFTAWALLSASLPRDSGELAITGLRAPVTVQRDARGIPVISGADYTDVVTALGFVHAQDRYFQMDVLRRTSAGELSELFGAATISNDRANRVYRFRRVATALLERLPAEHRAWIEAYTRGVNAGLADMGASPFEYLLLRTRPAPWRPEDCLLAHFTMYQTLSAGARDEKSLDAMRAALPADLVAFLTPETSRFDCPLIGPPGDPIGPLPIPTDVQRPKPDGEPVAAERHPLGSNGWAVAAQRTADGRAILANDMHLPLFVPNIWYRAQLQWGGAGRDEHMLVGVTLPGVHALVAGSNRHVAWGFTNVTGDFEDYIIVEPDPADPVRYLTPDGPEPFGAIIEEINVKGRHPELMELRSTRWGVISATDAAARPLVLRWPALDPEIVNLALFDMPEARTVEDALAVARRWYGPPQNAMLADSAGRVAWTVTGWLPRREGFNNRFPASWARPGVGWHGPLHESDRPVLVDPPDGVVFSANQRTVPVDRARRIGYAWSSGERAARIAEVLRASNGHTERTMLALQLDTVSDKMRFYQRIALAVIAADDAELAEPRRIVESWNGRADADQAAFRILAQFRARLFERARDPLLEPCASKDPKFRYVWFQSDEPLMRMLEERPANLLPAGYSDWPALIRAAFASASTLPAGALSWSDPRASWGDANRARISHYLSLAVPALGPFLNMPRDPLPGHTTTVRVQSSTFGASERLVVSPGHESDAILHMPTGQSGNPLSPYHADGQADWVRGEPTPLLAGPAASEFTLLPAP